MSSKRWRAVVKSNLKWSNELVENLLLALSNFIAKNISSKAKILMQNLGSNYRSGKNYWEVINITWTIMSIHPYIRKFFFRSSNVGSSGHTSLYLFFGNKAKARFSKRVLHEKKAHQMFPKKNISYPLICTRTCAYQGVINVGFPENLVCFLFLWHPFWDLPFWLITNVLQF